MWALDPNKESGPRSKSNPNTLIYNMDPFGSSYETLVPIPKSKLITQMWDLDLDLDPNKGSGSRSK